MDLEKILNRITIRPTGAIIMGSTVTIDAHEPGYPIRIVTHIHHDHIKDLSKSIQESSIIIGTPATLEILRELGYVIPENKSLPLDYGRSIELPDGELELIYSKHVIGSAQVLFKDHVLKLSIGYTSDFKEPGTSTPIMDVDILIIESTYGKPEWSRPMKELTGDLFIDLVKELLAQGPVYVYAYHGKLQEAMDLLRKGGVIAPFIAPYKVYKISKISEKYGYTIGELYLDNTESSIEVMKTKWYVYFEHLSRIRRRVYSSPSNASHIILTGWEFNETCRKVNDRVWKVALSDHADFEELLIYVKESSPKLVIVDRSRAGYAADVFAKEIRNRLNIKALSMPRPLSIREPLHID